MRKRITELTIKVEFAENVETDEDVHNSVDCGDIEERYFLSILPGLYRLGNVSDADLIGAKVFMETETGTLLRACPCCGKFETLINDWCELDDPCPDADCSMCEERAARIRCDETQGGCGYRSPMRHTAVEDAEEYWNTVADSLDEIDERSCLK